MRNTFKEKTKALLLWSQKYTKTDMLYAARGGGWSLAGQGSGLVLSFLLALAFGNLLTPTSYGQYKYILALAGLLSALSLTGSNTAVIQSVARGFEGMFKKVVSMNLRWGLALGLIGGAAAAYYFWRQNYLLGWSLVIISVFVPLLESVNFYNCFLVGKKLWREKTLYETIAKIINVLALLATLIFTKNILILVFVYFTISTVTTMLAYAWTVRKQKPNNLVDAATLPFIKHLSFMNALGTVAEQLDSILIFHFLGSASVALYVFSQVPIDQLTSLIRAPLIQLIQPKLAEKNIALFKRALFAKAGRLFLFLIPVVGLAIVLTPWFFRWLFPQYLAAIPYTQVYALVILFMPFIFFTESLQMHGRTRELYLNRLVISPIKIILLFALLPGYGIWGAIMAIFLTKFANLLMLIYIFRKI